MLTTAEVSAIYALDNVTVTEKEAAQDLAHAMQDNPTYAKLLQRINGYAKQQALEIHADGCEAAEFETNYE